MRTVSFVRKLGRTHVGKSNTNDYYIYFPKRNKTVIENFFTALQEEEFDVTDLETGNVYQMKVTFPRKGQECRIVKDFAQYVRDKKLDAGDDVIFEKRYYDNNTVKYFIDHRSYDNMMLFEYKSSKDAYTTQHPERLEHFFSELPLSIQVEGHGGTMEVVVEHYGDFKVRGDSPIETPHYQFSGLHDLVNDKRPLSSFILEKQGSGMYRLKIPFEWKFYELGGQQ